MSLVLKKLKDRGEGVFRSHQLVSYNTAECRVKIQLGGRAGKETGASLNIFISYTCSFEYVH